jgi:hypothetical protein
VKGTNSTELGAPLYGMVETVIRDVDSLNAADATFKVSDNEIINVEIFDGLQDSFFYSEGRQNGKPVYDAEDCTYSRNNPLWTFRFTNKSGQSFDLSYQLHLVVNENPAMPLVKVEKIVGQRACYGELLINRASPDRVN